MFIYIFFFQDQTGNRWYFEEGLGDNIVIILACNRCEAHIADFFFMEFDELDDSMDCYIIRAIHTHNLRFIRFNVLRCAQCGQFMGSFDDTYCYLEPENVHQLFL